MQYCLSCYKNAVKLVLKLTWYSTSKSWNDRICFLDLDADGILTIQEYISVGSDVDVDSQKDDWAVERRKEFRKVIDVDHDGKVTKLELEVSSGQWSTQWMAQSTSPHVAVRLAGMFLW